MGEACLAIPYQNTASSGANIFAGTAPGEKWFAIKVRTGGEPVAAASLELRGFETYSPMRQERRRYSDRMKVVKVAAFPGYLFCRFDLNRKVGVLSSPGVDYIVGLAGEPTAIGEAEIDGIRRLIEAGADVTPALQPGQKVRVTHGALEGVEGMLMRNGNGSRLVVSIDLLRHSVSLDIDENEVCAVSEIGHGRQSN